MYISDHTLEEQFEIEGMERLYEFYDPEDYEPVFEAVKRLYGEGNYKRLAR